MSKPAIDHFTKEVSAVIDRFRFEYEITYAELVGALFLIIFTTSKEMDEETIDP